MLLALGFGAGAIGAIDSNALLGENLISAMVSIAVGIILFDAGLGLNSSQLTGARVVRRLLSIGILVTWGGMPMFINTPGEDFRIVAAGDRPKLKAGQELIGLIDGKAMTR